MAESLILQILTGDQPEEVKERLAKQRKILQNKLRRQANDTLRKKENAKRRKKYKEDPEFRARIKQYRKEWWERKTEEEKKEIHYRAKLAKLERNSRLPPEEVEARYREQVERKKKKYQTDHEYREMLKAKERERRANMSKEERSRIYQKRKENEALLPPAERERRAKLKVERCRRYREKKKLQSISNGKGTDDGTRTKHNGSSLHCGEASQ